MAEGMLDLRIGSFDEIEKGAEYKVLDTDTYRLRIKSWKFAPTKTGKAQIQWNLEVHDDPEHPEDEGHVVVNRTMLEGAGRSFFDQFIVALNTKKQKVTFDGELTGAGAKAWLDTLLGCKVVADVKKIYYDGSEGGKAGDQNNITRFLPDE